MFCLGPPIVLRRLGVGSHSKDLSHRSLLRNWLRHIHIHIIYFLFQHYSPTFGLPFLNCIVRWDVKEILTPVQLLMESPTPISQKLILDKKTIDQDELPLESQKLNLS